MPTRKPRAAGANRRPFYVAAVGAALALPLGAGCTSEPPKVVMPEPGAAPPPSLEPGDVPDTDKLKRVPLD